MKTHCSSKIKIIMIINNNHFYTFPMHVIQIYYFFLIHLKFKYSVKLIFNNFITIFLRPFL